MSKIGDFFNKILTGTGDGIGAVANTALSLIRDKTADPETSLITEKIRKGVSISSKRVLNITGTAAIITTALSLIAINGVGKWNIILLGIGVAYNIGMSFVTAYSEKS